MYFTDTNKDSMTAKLLCAVIQYFHDRFYVNFYSKTNIILHKVLALNHEESKYSEERSGIKEFPTVIITL